MPRKARVDSKALSRISVVEAIMVNCFRASTAKRSSTEAGVKKSGSPQIAQIYTIFSEPVSVSGPLALQAGRSNRR